MIGLIKSFFTGGEEQPHLREVITGGAVVSIANVIAILSGFIFSLIMARVYGAWSTGVYSIIQSIFMLTMIIASFGFNTAILKYMPLHEVNYSILSARRVYRKMSGMLLISGAIISACLYMLAAPLAGSLLNKPYMQEVIEFSAPLLLIFALSRFFIQSLRALKDIKLYSIIIVLEPVLRVVLLLLLSVYFFSELDPVYSYLISIVLICIVSYLLVERLIAGKIDISHNKINAERTRDLISVSMPMLLTSLMQVVIAETDTIMLGIFKSAETVGIYAISFKIAAFTSFFLGVFNAVLAPKFSELFQKKELHSLKLLAQKTATFSAVITLPIAIIFLVFGNHVLEIFGSEFMTGHVALSMLVIGQMVNVISGSVGYFLDMTGHQKAFNIIVCSSAVMNIVLNLILIPPYGLEGAAFASMLSLIYWNITATIYTYKKFGFTTSCFPIASNIKSKNL